MSETLQPPIAQKPLSESGHFSTVWSRFFLNLSTHSEQSPHNNVQWLMSILAQQNLIHDIRTDIENDKTEVVLQQASYTDKLRTLELQIENNKLEAVLQQAAHISELKVLELQIENNKLEMVLQQASYTDKLKTLEASITDLTLKNLLLVSGGSLYQKEIDN